MNPSDEEIDNIRELYASHITIPEKETIPKNQFFLCPVGLVGAGKSTTTKPLTELFSLVRISSDEIREILKKKGFNYERVMDIVRPLAEKFAQEGYSLAFDSDCGSPATIKVIEEIAAKINAKIIWIHINPPEEFILHKLRTYTHTWLFKDANQAIDNYFQQKERRVQENTHFDFLTSIDTSRSDLAQQITEIARLIASDTNNSYKHYSDSLI